MQSVEQILKKISEQWFLREPAYFALYCLQRLEPNVRMNSLVRVGKGRLEYNPLLLERKTFNEIEQLMRIELIRIFLKHPYERQPSGICRVSMGLGSDVTICDNYNSSTRSEKLPLLQPDFFSLPSGECFEYYTKKIDEQLDSIGESDDEESDAGDETEVKKKSLSEQISEKRKLELKNYLDRNKDKAELWEEDQLKIQEINDLIKSLSNWGTIPGNIVAEIEASTKARIDYRQIMQGFRGSILSSQHQLTRMRPNRRTGFDQMGSKRKFNTRLLVAVDVSGSISDRSLSDFYSVINKMFKYGIDEIDCVQFDYEMGEVKNIRKASRKIEVTGRGGTSFQPIFDYLVTHPEYDGLIILTDGYAQIPTISDSVKTEILWVCENEKSYNDCHRWMELTGRVCWMIL